MLLITFQFLNRKYTYNKISFVLANTSNCVSIADTIRMI